MMVKKKKLKRKVREDYQKSFIHVRPEPKYSPPKCRTSSAISSIKSVD